MHTIIITFLGIFLYYSLIMIIIRKKHHTLYTAVMPFHTLCIHLFAVLSYSVPVALLISWELVNMSLSWECLLPAPE